MKIKLEGKVLEVGGNVEVVDGCFKGLKGVITEIATGLDKETDNVNEDIYVSLEEPTDKDIRDRINNDIKLMTNGSMNDINEFGIDLIILAPYELSMS